MTPEEIKAIAAELLDAVRDLDRQESADDYDDWEAGEYRRLSGRCLELETKIADLESAWRELTHAITESKARRPLLATLVDFLDGKITHVVHPHIGPLITSAADAFLARDEWSRRKPRLVSLVPSPKSSGVGEGRAWEITGWMVNTYIDGSGGDEPAIPCRSLAEAEAKVAELFAADVDLWRRQRAGDVNKQDRRHRVDEVRHWKRYVDSGVVLPWPADLVAHFNDGAATAHAAAVAKAEAYVVELAASPIDRPLDVEGQP